MRKIHYLTCFSKDLTNHALIFRAFGRKTQIVGKLWENFESFWSKFIRKTELLAIFGKAVAKNRAFGNNIIFIQQFFYFGEGCFLCSPCRRLCNWHHEIIVASRMLTIPFASKGSPIKLNAYVYVSNRNASRMLRIPRAARSNLIHVSNLTLIIRLFFQITNVNFILF